MQRRKYAVLRRFAVYTVEFLTTVSSASRRENKIDKLRYSNTRDALNKHVDPEDKGVAKRDTLGGKQPLTVIKGSGVVLSGTFLKARHRVSRPST